MYMRKDLIKKAVVTSLVGLSIYVVGSTGYAFTYVGDRTSFYPKEEYSIQELIANKLRGFDSPYTIEEMKQKNWIAQDAVIKSINKTEVDWYSESNEKILEDYKKDLEEEKVIKEIEWDNKLKDYYETYFKDYYDTYEDFLEDYNQEYEKILENN